MPLQWRIEFRQSLEEGVGKRGSEYGSPRAQIWAKPDSIGLRWTRRAQELCESRGGRPGLPVPNAP